jgi:thiol:disulfide interchange protein DsbD
MGVPLLLVGASAGHFLPRAGAWLERVQHVFGVVSLGMAIWFLSRILPSAITLALWALLLIGTGIFLRALEPLHEAVSGWQRLWKGLGVSMVCYGAVLIVGAAAGAEDVLKPLAPLAQRGVAVAAENHQAFVPVKDLEALNAAVRAAAAAGRPALLDVYADWCVECKHLERETFADPAVRSRLAGYTLLRADVTANDPADRALLAGLSLFGPPAVLLFDASGTERRNQRLVGYAAPTEFLARLEPVGRL